MSPSGWESRNDWNANAELKDIVLTDCMHYKHIGIECQSTRANDLSFDTQLVVESIVCDVIDR